MFSYKIDQVFIHSVRIFVSIELLQKFALHDELIDSLPRKRFPNIFILKEL